MAGSNCTACASQLYRHIGSAVPLRPAKGSEYYKAETQRYTARIQAISTTQLDLGFNALTGELSLSPFRFRKDDIYRIVYGKNWSPALLATGRNRYACRPLPIACVILCRLGSPAPWKYMWKYCFDIMGHS